MKITMAQISSGFDKTKNLEMVRQMVAEAVGEGSDLVIFPEFTMFEHTILDQSFVSASEPLDGDFCTGLREIAKEFEIVLVAGVLEEVPDEGRAYNTVVVVGSDGHDIAKYRKLHLYDAFGYRESDIVRPGEHSDPCIFDVQGIRFGVMTCYDIRFPEMCRFLVDAGVEVAVLPASWTPGIRKEDHWKVLSRARAIENTIFMASVCQAPPISTGGSLLVDPMGVVVGEIGETASTLTRDILPSRIVDVRKKNPCLQNRRFKVSPI